MIWIESLRRATTVVAVAVVGLSAPVSGHSGPRAFRDCPDCPEVVALLAGRFRMGSPDSEVGRDATEGPMHDVTIEKFALGRTDVTRGQYAAFVAATHRPVTGGCAWAGKTGPTPDPDASWAKMDIVQDDTHPVVCVTWADTQDYARWLSGRTGKTYRLPSEAEWEYAARAGSSAAFPWGAEPSHEQANYGGEACCSALASGRDKWVGTSPVGSFPANGFGLFDMSGNVLQWVQDCLHDYAAAPAGGSPVETKGDCTARMLRGGDWGDPPRMIRAAFRNYAPPTGATIATYRSAGVGFRIARDLP
jgi:formylglycine-generating enzyme required for sulfatase activity